MAHGLAMNFTTLSETLALPSDQDASGRTLGPEEIDFLKQAIESGALTSTRGNFVKTLESRFAQNMGVRYAYACSSGTAAIHCAVAAVDPEPGDEIVTSPITDMGALTPILYQGAIPVFAEVDPRTCNVTARTIEPCLSPRTRAIIATHLFGHPCEMDDILALAHRRNIPVIEDCAQSLMATWDGKRVGTLGQLGCFSLQQGKHITTGEGGIVTTNDETLARRVFLFINKGWGYGDSNPDHYFLALNYRMSELQGACAAAQLEKLEWVSRSRIRIAEKLSARLHGLKGIELPCEHPKAVPTYCKYCLRVNDNMVPGGSVALAGKLKAWRIPSAPRYIQKPAFMCQVFRERRTFGNSGFPFTLARPEAMQYDARNFPLTMEALDKILVLPLNEKYQDSHIEYIAHAMRESLAELRR
jgi:dTDP-4-amino-4,6-dideoxygalactose transaminase